METNADDSLHGLRLRLIDSVRTTTRIQLHP